MLLSAQTLSSYPVARAPSGVTVYQTSKWFYRSRCTLLFHLTRRIQLGLSAGLNEENEENEVTDPTTFMAKIITLSSPNLVLIFTFFILTRIQG